MGTSQIEVRDGSLDLHRLTRIVVRQKGMVGKRALTGKAQKREKKY